MGRTVFLFPVRLQPVGTVCVCRMQLVRGRGRQVDGTCQSARARRSPPQGHWGGENRVGSPPSFPFPPHPPYPRDQALCWEARPPFPYVLPLQFFTTVICCLRLVLGLAPSLIYPPHPPYGSDPQGRPSLSATFQSSIDAEQGGIFT